MVSTESVAGATRRDRVRVERLVGGEVARVEADELEVAGVAAEDVAPEEGGF